MTATRQLGGAEPGARAGALERLARELGGGEPSVWREDASAREVPCFAPDSEGAFSAALRIAREEKLRAVPVGLGSKSSWYRPAAAVDVALSTRSFCGVVSYEPGDGTVRARAGTAMSELARAVAAGGHHLTPDVPCPERSTLGGVLAAGQSGFDRLRHGPSRHALLGARVALADGTVAKSGGQLVKNVTGYDLHRLYCGSHGTLCVILEASLRLFPAPEDVRHLSLGCESREEALARAREALRLAVRPHAVWAHDHDAQPHHDPDHAGAWRVELALAGRREVVAHEAQVAAELWRGAAELAGDGARAHLAAARDRMVPLGRWPALEVLAQPTDLGAALARVARAAEDLGLGIRTLAHPGIAQAFIDLQGLDASNAAALHGALEGAAGRAVWRAAPRELRAAVDPWGPTSPALPLMRRLKAALDPSGVFAAGRFHGGL